MATTAPKEQKEPKKLFEGLRIHIASSVPIAEREELRTKIEQRGGQVLDRNHIEDATHVVTEGLHFEDSEDVTSVAKVVTPAWIRHSLLGKLQAPAYYSPDPSKIFSGCIVAIDGLLAADAEAISSVVVSKGGQHRQNVTVDTTHLICAAAHGKMYQIAMNNRNKTSMKVVVPHWFDDSYKTDHLMPTKMYEYPNPPLFNPVRQSSLVAGEQVDGVGRTKDARTMIKTVARAEKDTGSPVKNFHLAPEAPQCNVWDGKMILLSRSLEFAEGRRDAFAAEIERTGGRVRHLAKGEDEAAAVSDVDIIIMKYREGKVYLRALEQRKIVGSLAWLLYVEYAQKYSSPLDHILHYPSRSQPVPGLAGKTITATNYTGEARDYIKKLILAVGATFTPVMSSKTHYLIAPHLGGEKAGRAKDWSIPTVNHFWLEDTFKAWRAPAVTEAKYVRWQTAVQYTEVIHRVPLDTFDLTAEIERVKMEVTDEDDRIEISDDEEDTLSPPVEEFVHTEPPSSSAEQVEKLVSVEAAPDDGDFGMTDDDPPPPLPPSSPSKRPPSRQEIDRLMMPPPPLPSKIKAPSPTPSQASSGSGPRRTLAPVIERSSSMRRVGSVSPSNSQSRSQSQSQSSSQSQPSASQAPPAPVSVPAPAPAPVSHLASPPNTGPSVVTPTKAPTDPITPEYLKLPSPYPEEPSPTKRLSDKRKVMPPPAPKPVFKDVFPSWNSGHSGFSTPKKPKAVSQNNRREDSDEDDTTPKASTSKHGNAAGGQWPWSKPLGSQRLQQQDMEVDEDDRDDERTSNQGLKRSKSSASLKKSGSRKSRSPPPLSRTKSRVDQPSSDLSSAPPTDSEDNNSGSDSEADQRPTKKKVEQTAPVTIRKRSAAQKAEQKLRTDMQDLNKYTLEMQTGKIRGAWEGPSGMADDDEETKTKLPGKKRVRSKADDAGPSISKKRKKSEEREIEPPVERVKQGLKRSGTGTPPVTGIKFVATKIELTDEENKILGQLGIKQASDPTACTHLVAKAIARTEKFLLALCNGPIVATERWLKDCVKQKAVLPAENYPLMDTEGEAKWRVSLSETLERARGGKGAGKTLFQGHTLYITPGLPVDPDFMKKVISHAGGTCKTGLPTLRVLQQPDSLDHHHIVTVPGDDSYWHAFADHGIPLYTLELVVMSVLTQKLPEWGKQHLLPIKTS